MNMTEKYAGVNKVASETTFVIPEGTSTEVDLRLRLLPVTNLSGNQHQNMP